MRKIPVTIGITGHRDIRPDAVPALEALVKDKLQDLISSYPDSEFVIVDALASGADLLCAEIAMELGLKLIAVLPFEPEDYLNDFSKEDSVRFNRALAYASKRILLSDTPGTRDEHYRRAGEYIADKSHLLFALWDGIVSDPNGCGTDAIVYYAMHHAPSYSVFHFLTPRTSQSFNPELKILESDEGITLQALNITDS